MKSARFQNSLKTSVFLLTARLKTIIQYNHCKLLGDSMKFFLMTFALIFQSGVTLAAVDCSKLNVPPNSYITSIEITYAKLNRSTTESRTYNDCRCQGYSSYGTCLSYLCRSCSCEVYPTTTYCQTSTISCGAWGKPSP